MQTRILLADDHPVIRAGLKTLIDEYPDLVVVAEAGDGDQLAAVIANWQPDACTGTGVLILDTKMPNFDDEDTSSNSRGDLDLRSQT